MWIRKTVEVEVEVEVEPEEIINRLSEDTIIEEAQRILECDSDYYTGEILGTIKATNPRSIVCMAIDLLRESPELGTSICGKGLARFCKQWMELKGDEEESEEFLKGLGVEIPE